ncbi:MAG: hypothetical protein HLUCCO16_05085 [Phormidium sp. OSCR]|nr:MAG: hypothetical protein HLUCCO16_05085 [Phormidium sp. OSCR]
MTILTECLPEIARKRTQVRSGTNRTFQGLGLPKTLENLIATQMQHRPSIRHRYGGDDHRLLVPTQVNPHCPTQTNHHQDQERESQEHSETDLRSDRSQGPTIFANITNLVSEVFALETPQSCLLVGLIQ